MNDIKLADGSIMEVKVNMLTIKILGEMDLKGFDKKKEELTQEEQMDLFGKLSYAILRSNGRKDILDEEDAMMLIPVDDVLIVQMFSQFKKEMEKFKKKQANKM